MKANEFTTTLSAHGFHFITGVPDSIFKHIILEINEHPLFHHVISNNEGEACALATGYYLGSQNTPVIYMQNSGLGNSMNPLTSLLDPYIYSIPALLLISWRGAPNIKDEPQHKRMGQIVTELLNLLEIPFRIADSDINVTDNYVAEAAKYCKEHKSPFAILFKNDVVESPSAESSAINETEYPTREEALNAITDCFKEDVVFVSTTGKTSRELFEIRKNKIQNHSHDFLTVGSMGCSSVIALGLAITQSDKKIVALDGDGACLMRMESLALIGSNKPKNYLHIIFDNNAYESTGGQPTLSNKIDFTKIALACGYQQAIIVSDIEHLTQAIHQMTQYPVLIVMKVASYSRSNLGRPTNTPIENKVMLMDYLHKKSP
jgi:phosphonopyruvate decarboxylase